MRRVPLMKRILLLCTAIVFLLLMAGCTQTAQHVQPAVTATPARVVAVSPATAGTLTTAPIVTTTFGVSDNTIIIKDMAYTPAQITVKAGSTVRWVNEDKIAHRVLFLPDAKIDTFVLSSGQTFSVKFYNAGIYNYSCSIYPDMQGSVVVT
jgi:plastocyanin